MAKFTCNFISYTLKRTVDITVIIPSVTIPESMGMALPKGEKPRHQKADKYPVLYLLHGMGNNHAQWTGYTNVELFAEEQNMAVVMLSAENKSYVNIYGDNFYDFVSEELPDFVKEMFPVSDRPEDTYIAGLSMGGFGTLVHALSHPERFAAFGAFSAAVQLDPYSLAGGPGAGKASVESSDDPAALVSVDGHTINPDYDPMSLLKADVAAGKKLPKMYVACGENDFLYEANKAFVEEMKTLGCEVEVDFVPGYTHEWRFWNLEVEKFLKWIPRTDAYAGGKRQV